MSSLQENSTVPLDVVDKRKVNFFRSDSFEKLQFNAFCTLQLAGTLLSHKSLMQIFEALQYKSRTFMRKPAVLSWSIFKMACSVLLYWVDVLSRYTGFNVVFEKKVVTSTNVQPEKTYILRVQKRKSVNTRNEVAVVKPLPPVKPEKSIDAEQRLKPIVEIDAAQRLSSSNLWKPSDSDSEMGSNASISNRHNVGLVVIVYGSATLVYIQLMLLAVFLQSATAPPGLVFLVSSLAFIGFIVFKMCFVKTKSKDDQSTQAHSSPSKSTSVAAVKSSPSPPSKISRLSRSTTRRFLYFHNKTLSKIKLL